jgi:hypothetical protein
MLLTQDVGQDIHAPVDSEDLFRRERVTSIFIGGPIHGYLAPAPECIQEEGREHGASGKDHHCVQRLSQPRHRRRK